MIYLRLLLAFLKIGMFAFGGAYAAIPLIQDVVMENGWMDEVMYANLVAISEATPGSIMVNMATYVGSRQAGVLGALLATIGVILPSFIILLIIVMFFHKIIRHRKVQAVMNGIKPCLMGVILATGIYMAFSTLFGELGAINVDKAGCLIFVILLFVESLYKKVKKQEFSPIALIIIAAVCGGILY